MSLTKKLENVYEDAFDNTVYRYTSTYPSISLHTFATVLRLLIKYDSRRECLVAPNTDITLTK